MPDASACTRISSGPGSGTGSLRNSTVRGPENHTAVAVLVAMAGSGGRAIASLDRTLDDHILVQAAHFDGSELKCLINPRDAEVADSFDARSQQLWGHADDQPVHQALAQQGGDEVAAALY